MCQIFLSLPIPMFCSLLLTNSLLLLLLNIQPATADPIDISGLLSQSANQRLNELRGKPSHLKKAAPPKSLIGARGDLADLQRVPFTFARGIDPRSVRRCQFPNGLLRPSATECEDELESESCASIFGTGEPRPTLCLNSELADLAKRCARTCRLCCESPKFNCVDSGAQLINCQEQRSKCKDPLWQRIMMAVCEHTCGLCSADQCFDQAPDCASLRSLCFNRPVSPLFRQQCPLTCGLCKPTAQNEENKKKLETNNGPLGEEGNKAGGGGGGDVIVLVKKKRPRCQDLSPSCEGNGHLCTDENYSTLFRDKCAKTCGHCRAEEGEEEVTDMVKRIRHATVAAAHAQRPMERPPAAANVPKKRRRRPSASSSFSRGRSGVASRMADRPIIIIDKRRMFIQQQREEEKERTEVEAEDGGDVLHISREILADQRTAAEQRKRRPAGIGPSPIVVFFGGGNVGEKKGRGGKKEGRKSGKSDREDGNDENDDNDEENNLNEVVLPDEEKATEDGDDSVEEREADINAGQTIRGIREEGVDGEGATLPNEKTSKGNRTQNLQEEKGKGGNIEQKENTSIQPSNSNEAALLVESILEEKAELNVVMNRSRNRKKNPGNGQKRREEAGGGAFDENTRLAAKRMSQQILDILQGLPKEPANKNGGLELGKNDNLKKRKKREASSNSEKNKGRRPAAESEERDFRPRQQKKQPDKKMMEQMVEEILDSTDEVMSKSESSESGGRSGSEEEEESKEQEKSKWSFSPGRVEIMGDENEENDEDEEDEEAMEATEEIGTFRGILQILGRRWGDEDERDESGEEVLEIEDGNEGERAENDSSSSMESNEEKNDEESGSSEADEEEPEANPESLEVFEAAPKQPLLLDRLEEKEKAKASTIPGLKEEPPSSQFVGGMGGGGRKRPAIIRVRLRPKGGKQPLKRLLDKIAEDKTADRADQDGEKEEEEVEEEMEAKPAIVIGRNRRRPFDGILRDRQGNALRVEELPKGIGGALAEVRRRYGLGNWSDEEPAKALLETGQNISNGLTAIVAELRALKRTMPPPSPAIEENDELLKGRMRGRREGRETEEEGEDGKEVPKKKRRKSGGKEEREKRKKFKKLDDSELEEKETTKDDKEDEEEKMLKVLKKLLGVETAQKKPAHKGKQEKKTPKQAQLSANQLLEALRRMLQPTAQQPQQGKANDRLPNPTQPKVAAALLTDRASGNVRLVPVLRVPATAAGGGGQPTQFIVTGGGGQLLQQPNGQFPLQGMVAVLANGLAPHRQPRQQQPQIILTTGGSQPIQSQPAVFVQQPQQQPQLPQQMQPTTFVQPQQPPQQQIVYQVQPQQQQPSQVQAQPPVPQQPSFQVQQQPPQPQPQPAAFQPPIAVQDPPPQPRPQQRQLVVLPQSRFARGPFSLLRTSVGGTRAAPAPSSGNCRDYYPYCEQIVPRGFCNSEFYPTRMKREFCPQSCNLC